MELEDNAEIVSENAQLYEKNAILSRYWMSVDQKSIEKDTLKLYGDILKYYYVITFNMNVEELFRDTFEQIDETLSMLQSATI